MNTAGGSAAYNTYRNNVQTIIRYRLGLSMPMCAAARLIECPGSSSGSVMFRSVVRVDSVVILLGPKCDLNVRRLSPLSMEVTLSSAMPLHIRFQHLASRCRHRLGPIIADIIAALVCVVYLSSRSLTCFPTALCVVHLLASTFAPHCPFRSASMATLYRKAAFVAVGLSNFTQQAFHKRQKHFTDDLSKQDMSGRVMAVTGANSGIGLEAARAFLLQHGHVHIICRDKGRGEKARDELMADYQTRHPTPPPSSLSSVPRVQLHLVDLSSIAQTKAFCRSFARSQQPLHILVNNAGCMVHKRTLTSEGLETNFATNVASTYAMTEELLPVLWRCNTAEYVSRVISVSSGGMLTQDVELDDLQSEKAADGDATYIYAQNKRQQVVLTEAWQQREAAEAAAAQPCVVFHAMHPGWADTPGVQVAMGDFYNQMKGKWRTAAEGADTIAYLATAPSMSVWPGSGSGSGGVAALKGGEFWLDREVVSKTLPLGRYKRVGDEGARQELVKRIKALVDKIEPTEQDMQRYSYLLSGSTGSEANGGDVRAAAPADDGVAAATDASKL